MALGFIDRVNECYQDACKLQAVMKAKYKELAIKVSHPVEASHRLADCLKYPSVLALLSFPTALCITVVVVSSSL